MHASRQRSHDCLEAIDRPIARAVSLPHRARPQGEAGTLRKGRIVHGGIHSQPRGSLGRRVLLALGILAAGTLAWLAANGSHAVAAGAGGLAPLNTLPVPTPPNEGDFIADKTSAVKLGKALFWDMRRRCSGSTPTPGGPPPPPAGPRTRTHLHPPRARRALSGPPGHPTPARHPLP